MWEGEGEGEGEIMMGYGVWGGGRERGYDDGVWVCHGIWCVDALESVWELRH